MVEVLNGMFQAQLAWLTSPVGIGIAIGCALLVGSGLMGRIVLVVERELQIMSDRRQRSDSGEELVPSRRAV